MKIQCNNCGADITEQVNKATASRAGKSTLAKHGKEHYQAMSELGNKKRWDAYKQKRKDDFVKILMDKGK